LGTGTLDPVSEGALVACGRAGVFFLGAEVLDADLPGLVMFPVPPLARHRARAAGVDGCGCPLWSIIENPSSSVP
jgi:hypothetical protein